MPGQYQHPHSPKQHQYAASWAGKNKTFSLFVLYNKDGLGRRAGGRLNSHHSHSMTWAVGWDNRRTGIGGALASFSFLFSFHLSFLFAVYLWGLWGCVCVCLLDETMGIESAVGNCFALHLRTAYHPPSENEPEQNGPIIAVLPFSVSLFFLTPTLLDWAGKAGRVDRLAGRQAGGRVLNQIGWRERESIDGWNGGLGWLVGVDGL
jgi:hypothetical protein